MVDQFLNMLKSSGADAILSGQNVGANKEGILEEAGKSIFSGLQSQIANGGLKSVLDLVKNSDASYIAGQSVNQNIAQNFAGSIAQKFGIDSGMAKTMAAAVIPALLSKVFSSAKSSDNNSVSLGGLFDSLTGGQASKQAGFGNMLSKLAGGGLDKDGDGDVDMDDLVAHMSGFAKGGNSGGDGGGLLGKLGGMLGNLGK